MKKYGFSLPFHHEEVRIRGKDAGHEWDYNKSGQELYAALRTLPIGTFESLEIEIITNVFYRRYDLEQLKEIKHFLLDSKNTSLENDSYFNSHKESLFSYIKLISIRGMSMRKGLEKAIKIKKKDEEILQEISDKTKFS